MVEGPGVHVEELISYSLEVSEPRACVQIKYFHPLNETPSQNIHIPSDKALSGYSEVFGGPRACLVGVVVREEEPGDLLQVLRGKRAPDDPTVGS